MIDQLYQKNILRHAATACRSGHLDHPNGTATLQSPLCGDRITVEVKVKDDLISDLAYMTHSCVLCQASASIMGEIGIGLTMEDITTARREISVLLSDTNSLSPNWPDEAWQTYNIFAPVAEHRNRHVCVTLPLDALVQALQQSKAGTSEEGPAKN